MAKAIHKPPARLRYEQSHPTVSCRLSRDEYDLLKQRLEDLGGISFADFVKDSLGLLLLKIPDTKELKKKALNEGYTQGYNKARADYEIWYFCNVCGGRMTVTPNGGEHKEITGCLKGKGWGHASCHGQ